MQCDKATLKDLELILRKEMGIVGKDKVISLDDIAANRETLLKLKEKTLDYVSEVFMPNLLKILAHNPQNKYPDTTSLSAITMYLTTQGYARWQFVIQNNLEFVPFKNFEHLNLSSEQQVALKETLDKRVESVTSQNIQPGM